MAVRRAVITGAGLVSPLGRGLGEFWSGLVAGRSAISAVPAALGGDLPVTACGLVPDFDFQGVIDGAFLRRPRGRLPLFVQYALAATADALRSAALDTGAIEPTRLGVVIGCGSGGFSHIAPYFQVRSERGWSKVDPQVLPQIIPNAAVAHIAAATGARGYNSTIVASCSSGTQAIGEALRAIQLGHTDAILSGGTEAWITEIGLTTFTLLGALSKWKGDPDRASRPFDKDRSGFVPSEGAAVFVIEELGAATRRGAPILAEIKGYGCTNDAYHLVAPDPQGRGAAECISSALEDAALGPESIDYVNAHGTGTIRGDISETRALKHALGERARSIPVSATKSMLGHSMGASGALEVAACIQTIRTGVIHPTINLDTRDPLCDLDYVANSAREQEVRTVLKNSFGFGGHNACLVLAAPQS